MTFRKLFNILFKKILTKKVDLYKEEVAVRNYKSFIGLLYIGTLISFVVLMFGIIMSDVVTFNLEFCLLFFYFLILLTTSKLFIKKATKNITFLFYTILTPIMIMAILMGTFLDPYVPSITIMILICVLPIFILDKLWRIFLYITSIAVLYSICCYFAKDFQLFISDMIDLVIFYFLAIGVNFFTLNDRIDSVENFMLFREKSEIDLLTGIYNRGTGVEKIEQLIAEKHYGSLIIIDIDDFKQINDNFGHMYGDKALICLAETLKDHFSKDDIVFRMGGDEFIVYSVNLTEKNNCIDNFEALYQKINTTNFLGDKDYNVTISLGCCTYHNGKTNFNYLYKNSDKCLYTSKSLGKGRYHIL